MKSENPTTVRLSESVQKIKDRLSPIYGLKNILSAGILLFSRLSSDEQKKVIAEAHELEAQALVSAAEADEAKHRKKRGGKPAKSA